MSKFPYTKIGDYLNYEFIEKYAINQRILAKFIGVHNNRINEIIRHKRTITIDTDLRLCKFFKLEDGHFYLLQYRLEQKQIKQKIKNDLSKINTYDLFLENPDN